MTRRFPCARYNGEQLTGDAQSERVTRRSRRERDAESTGRLERLHEVTHHVDLGRLVELRLAPYDRIVEQVEMIGVELADELDLLTGTHEVRPTLGQHPHRTRNCNTSRLR